MRVRWAAFTVAELVVAIGLLAVIAVVVIGLFVRITASSSKSADQTVALEIANRVLDQYANSSPADWETASSKQDLQTRDPASKTTFHYHLESRPLTHSTSNMGDMYRLDVNVYWWTNREAEDTRRDYGRLRVRLSRCVFVEQIK